MSPEFKSSSRLSRLVASHEIAKSMLTPKEQDAIDKCYDDIDSETAKALDRWDCWLRAFMAAGNDDFRLVPPGL